MIVEEVSDFFGVNLGFFVDVGFSVFIKDIEINIIVFGGNVVFVIGGGIKINL